MCIYGYVVAGVHGFPSMTVCVCLCVCVCVLICVDMWSLACMGLESLVETLPLVHTHIIISVCYWYIYSVCAPYVGVVCVCVCVCVLCLCLSVSP